MNSDEFDVIWEEFHGRRPTLQGCPREDAADEMQVVLVERNIGTVLPAEYKKFSMKYGGGYVGSCNVFSFIPESDWYILDKLAELRVPVSFVPISDDETGGFYGFISTQGRCHEGLYYFDPDDGVAPSATHNSFYDYLADVALGSKIVGANFTSYWR